MNKRHRACCEIQDCQWCLCQEAPKKFVLDASSYRWRMHCASPKTMKPCAIDSLVSHQRLHICAQVSGLWVAPKQNDSMPSDSKRANRQWGLFESWNSRCRYVEDWEDRQIEEQQMRDRSIYPKRIWVLHIHWLHDSTGLARSKVQNLSGVCWYDC